MNVARIADDGLERTVDYDSVAAAARALADDPVNLIETFAERLCDLCLRKSHVQDVKVRIEKPGAIPGAVAGVEIVRLRQVPL